MPDGKVANLIAFLKFFNCLRLGNMSIVQDILALIDEFVKDFHRIITGYDLVATALRELGAIQHNITIPSAKRIT